MIRNRLLAAAAVSAALVLSACAAGTEPEVDPTAAACDAAEDFSAALERAREDVTEASTVGDLREIRGDVTEAYDRLHGSLQAVAADRLPELQDAWSEFRETAFGLSDEATLDEASEAVGNSLDDVRSAADDVLTPLGC